MTREEAKEILKSWTLDRNYAREAIALNMAIEALEQEPCADVLDKLDEIITDALDKSTDQKESQTLRWVLDKISEVAE